MYVGETGRFTCNTGSEYPAWQVDTTVVLPEHSGLNVNGTYIPPGINGTADDHFSTLTIEGSIQNNNTRIKCVNYPECCTVNFVWYSGVTFRVYGKSINAVAIEAIL